MNDFEKRKQNRIDRYHRRADKARNEAEAAFERSDELVRHIPPGQPILVGHHSEQAHRNTLEKSHNAMRRGVDLEKKADYYEQRAKSAERNTAIFSDDPNATEKLADKIERLEKRQALMRDANKLIRKNDTEGLLDLGFSESQIAVLSAPDFMGRIGFPDYALTNNSANIRRLKKRLEQIQANAERETVETRSEDGIRIVDNTEINRTQIFFPDKPSPAVRQKLKRSGFRWSPSNLAWQRHLSPQARYLAEQITKEQFD
jgi:hypothetical protein